MKKSVVREKMRRGEIILTAKMNFMNPNLAELIGLMGFDCLWICNEHQAIDRSLLENIIRTARITGIEPERIHRELHKGRIVIVAGFQGITDSMEVTTLGRCAVGDVVNIETDILGKYIEKLLTHGASAEA